MLAPMSEPRKSGIVSIVGRPNAGKSTLMNHLLGQKVSIVSDKPQTTRNRIVGILTEPRGQIVFLDTPGIHRPLHRMNVRMMDHVVSSFSDSDILVVIVDASTRFGRGDEFVLDMVSRSRQPETRYLLLNKIDMVRKDRLLPEIERYSEAGHFSEIIPISAKSGDGADALLDVLFRDLPEGEPRYSEEMVTIHPERFLVGELVREQVLANTRDELPYSTAIRIDKWEEDEEIIRIYASIVVERQGQKKIVVGKGGQMIKQIGTAARHEIEKLLDTRVHLDLHVKVEEDWRENENLLNELV